MYGCTKPNQERMGREAVSEVLKTQFSVSYDLKTSIAPQDPDRHRGDLSIVDENIRTFRPEINIDTPAALRWGAMQTAA